MFVSVGVWRTGTSLGNMIAAIVIFLLLDYIYHDYRLVRWCFSQTRIVRFFLFFFDAVQEDFVDIVQSKVALDSPLAHISLQVDRPIQQLKQTFNGHSTLIKLLQETSTLR